VDINKLKPLEKNPFKSQGDNQIKAIADSIDKFMEIDNHYCQVIINRMRKLNPNIEVKCLNREFTI
jgi:hypothetical protein